jgi:hypothetical protein
VPNFCTWTRAPARGAAVVAVEAIGVPLVMRGVTGVTAPFGAHLAHDRACCQAFGHEFLPDDVVFLEPQG